MRGLPVAVHAGCGVAVSLRQHLSAEIGSLPDRRPVGLTGALPLV
ncbi:hypothetical protein M2160_009323 [Streptomyces sp. SAI-117]|nr:MULTISPECIES: hypothetical protein [unclassified Streptomyces]MDH6554948.1 hypothetical protein [Streptomyces sp. SAI-041]MDH6574216.1 hypothetical protein [Streptomyces sp. SAI-117]